MMKNSLGNKLWSVYEDLKNDRKIGFLTDEEFQRYFLGFIVLTAYLVSIQSYRAPYMAPYAPNVATDKKDGLIKKPLSMMVYRPKSFMTLNSVRLQPKQNLCYRTSTIKKNKVKANCNKNKGAKDGVD